MKPWVLSGIRFYFRAMARVAPRVAGRHAYWLFSTPRYRARTPEAASAVMARARRFELDVEGRSVAAFEWAASRPDAPRVLLMHGWESRASRLAAWWVDPLLAAGFSVFAFDAPGHGESSGRRSGPLLFARSARRLADRVGEFDAVVGHSLGGLSAAIAITAAERIGQRPLDPHKSLVIAGAESGGEAMAYFCRVLGLPDDFLPLLLAGAAESEGMEVASFDGHRIMPSRQLPTLWLHDPDDPETSWLGAQRVAEAAPHVRLEAVGGLGHHKIVSDSGVIRRGVEFLAA
ncbi:MAG: alpha/beta fold hydrolase [Acidobacteriota bacterium]